MHKNGFFLRQAVSVPYYACTSLELDPGLRHGFSTRHGGVSLPPAGVLNLGFVPWDDCSSVEENRFRFLAALRIQPECLATVAQNHSAEFHIINTSAHQWNPRTKGDALLTARRHVALAIQVADCFPVLLADARTGSIAAVHAGWRGALARILGRTLEGMKQHFGTDPRDVLAALGPGIRSCCFEVGPEVASAFDAEYPGAELNRPHPDHRGKYLLDLSRSLHIQLAEAGVPGANVSDAEACTRCHQEEFFSFRAEGARAGRLMAVICRM
jgi:YfiH family protein